ncbi:MAG: hypothetical protein COB67_01495 [SAR324 cluster bacterium]|uniref:Ancillary SecYEG translocon subunit/Cell division coordinator CpoB TPR domain-containing protein n=1 Tax=SAR324 cluster bacterium TaxID=2024889 RepID=A0A2A4TAC1_9DELT|nr:MAG: hypothetical protein COB67_01495 [SAR324 cluster bacterium]
MATTPEVITEEVPQAPVMDDLFFHAADYIYKRKKLFTGLAIVVVAILLAAYGITQFIEYKQDLRNQALFQIETTLNDSQLSNTQKLETAIPPLSQFILEHQGTSQASIALFHRGSLYFNNQKLKEAEGDLRSVLSLLEKDSGFYVLGSVYLANILRDQDKGQQAIEILQAAKSVVMTDIILMELAETYLSLENKDQARQMLETLMKDYPTSLYQDRAKRLLELF